MFDLVQREERMRNGGIPEQRGQTTDYRALQLSDLMKNLCIKMHRIDTYLCMNFRKSLFLVTLLIFTGVSGAEAGDTKQWESNGVCYCSL